MKRMIEEVAGRMQEMVEQEARQREETEEKLIALLEDTCARVEKSLQQ